MDADPSEPLRRDVSALGRILGEALIEQEGRAFFDLEERIRGLSKQRRGAANRAKAAGELRAAIAALDTPTAERVARAFAHYFQVVNLAEQYHRVRRYRDYARGGESHLGPLAELVPALKAHLSRDDAEALLARACVELVFTAHPTEAQRRTVLDKHRRIADLLDRLERGGASPAETEACTAALREEVTILWQTEEIRQERPRVGDEVKNVLFYLEEILYPLIPRVYATVERAIEAAYGADARVRLPPLLRFGSWVGADMDGNPNVTPEIALDTAFAQAARAVALHLGQIDRLGARLSQSWRRAGVSRELLDSLRHDYALHPVLAATLEPRPTDEPYRQKLRWIAARLTATREAFVRARGGGPTEFGVGYATARALRDDLAMIERSLAESNGAHAGLAEVHGVVRQVEVFGFHLAKLDVRVPAEWARAAVREALGLAADAPLRADVLHRALADARVPPPPKSPGMRALDALAAMRRRVSEESAESFILSMTRGHEDMLAALVLARIAGLYRPEAGVADVSIVPLFETLADLERCPREVAAAIADPAYARYLALRGRSLEVMVGYSDSNKDAGIVASSFALYGAQKGIVEVERATGVAVKVFHGRGGSIGRGGGPSRRAIEGLPPGSIDGRFKLTEQGEVLGWKYLLPPIAQRNLELTVCGVLGASIAREAPDAAEIAEYEAAFARAAATSLATYRALVGHPRFVEYFQQSTPLDEIGALPLGSRPARRSGAASLDDLRAIPWVFAWNQSRQMVPGWFGAGRALRELVRERGAPFVRRMHQRWPFFATTLDAVAVALAIADMPIAAEYASLVSDKELARALFRVVALEYYRAVRSICAIAGRPTLLAEDSTLARSIELRNPYVDPLSFIQIELLRRKRALLREGKAVPQDLQRAVLITINGVAAGLRNTG